VLKSVTAAAFLIFCVALAAAAADPPANTPVFTKSTIEEAAYPWRFVDSPIKPVDTRRVLFHIGSIEFRTRLGSIRIIYLPIPPLAFTTPSRGWNEFPNAFMLTGMQIPQRPPKPKESAADVEVKRDDASP
jgi:hypothetical protein